MTDRFKSTDVTWLAENQENKLAVGKSNNLDGGYGCRTSVELEY